MTAPSTPPPVYSTSGSDLHPPVRSAPTRMEFPEKARYRAAAYNATRLWPGPIGELVSRELLVIEEFGWALGAGSFGLKLVAAVEDAWRTANHPLPRITPKTGVR